MTFRTLFIVACLFALPVAAQQTTPVLSVTGTSVVMVKPDLATLSIGVDARAPTADRALRLNSARMKAVIDLLTERGIDKADIQTRQFSLNPVWQNRNAAYDKPLEIIGFTISNVVHVNIRDLAALGPVLDAVTKSGANRIEGVQFAIAAPTPFLDKARALAVGEAIRKAKLYAAAAGMRLGDILTIDETTARARPQGGPELRAMADAVPIAEGELTLRASVTIRFRLR